MSRPAPPPDLRIARIHALPEGLGALRAAAAAEGFRFLDRLAADWTSGETRFDAPGEALFAAWRGGALVAIGGVTRDPWAGAAPEPSRTGRLRRFYVHPSARRRGVGAALLAELIAAARPHFTRLRLRTDESAAAFYAALGFAQTAEPGATHARPLD
ncbi:GNAT family N-acetyltransferase [Rhodovulum sp. DZ06]|uniref:GNAT family N-acetyltransferase n=1 Tax=Rhodovulum sp. DZ06 TaxID=3425126 RepID=UPI003D342FE9